MWGKNANFLGREAFGAAEMKPRAIRAPGTHYEYNDVRMNRFALSLLRVFNKPIPDVFRDEVMNPIGASTTWKWVPYTNAYVDIDGRRMASVSGGTRWGGGMWINTYDMARFGLLWLRNGKWGDRQIVSPAYVRMATTPSAHGPDYGFLWWLNTKQAQWPGSPADAFSARGSGGNIIFISPGHDLVVVGFSMGGQQAFHWGALYPAMVDAIAAICGTARTSPHNFVFLDGVRAALEADAAFAGGWYDAPPERGIRAFGRVYAGWVYSQDFYREREHVRLGLHTVEEVMQALEARYLQRDANDLLAMLWTWQHADVAAHPAFDGDLDAALAAITCRALVMPGDTDLYFRVRDSEIEVARMPRAELRVIPSIWGHAAGRGVNPPDNAFIDAGLRDVLARSSDSGGSYADAGRCARRNERIWRTARGIRSLGSFHGNMLTSAFGASIAASMATAYGCAGTSSGRISTGVWQRAHEIARHGEDEVGVGAVHLGQEPVDHLHRDVGPALDQLRTPALHVVVVEEIAHLRTGPAGLRQHRRDDAIGRPLQEVPDERDRRCRSPSP